MLGPGVAVLLGVKVAVLVDPPGVLVLVVARMVPALPLGFCPTALQTVALGQLTLFSDTG
jgi:hypothetical protein